MNYKIIVPIIFNLSMPNIEKRQNITIKSCGVHIARFLEYVWPVFNIMHEVLRPTWLDWFDLQICNGLVTVTMGTMP